MIFELLLMLSLLLFDGERQYLLWTRTLCGCCSAVVDVPNHRFAGWYRKKLCEVRLLEKSDVPGFRRAGAPQAL